MLHSGFLWGCFCYCPIIFKKFFISYFTRPWREWPPTTTGGLPPSPAANPAWPWVTPQTSSGTWATWSWWAGSLTLLALPSSTVLCPLTRSAPSHPSPITSAMTSPSASWRLLWSLSSPDCHLRERECSISTCTRARTCWRGRKETFLAASSESLWDQKS